MADSVLRSKSKDFAKQINGLKRDIKELRYAVSLYGQGGQSLQEIVGFIF